MVCCVIFLYEAEIKCITSRILNFSSQASFRFPFSSSAAAFWISCFLLNLERLNNAKITRLQFAGKNWTRTLDSCKIGCALYWHQKKKYFVIFCNFIFCSVCAKSVVVFLLASCHLHRVFPGQFQKVNVHCLPFRRMNSAFVAPY